MNIQELLNYIRYFREKANKNKLILFVGAGVSCNVEGMPSWENLIQEMAKAIDYKKCCKCKNKTEECENVCDIKYKFSQDEYLKIPQYVFNNDEDLYKEIIKNNIKSLDIDAPLSNAIIDLNPAHIITTNYDKLIENCKNELRDNYDVIIHDKDLLDTNKNQYIIKMHGDINYIYDIVLKEADYLEYSQNHVLIEMFVKSLLTDHTILFLGYSLNDYNVKLIISWINYIRTQNKAFDRSSDKFAYIALDNEKISDIEKSYFEGNKIGVINLNSMPLIKDIPNTIFFERGKRLYSFLKVINDVSLERYFGLSISYDSAISFMKSFRYVDSENIFKLLSIGPHNFNGLELIMYSDENFDSLVKFLKSSTDNAKQLEQIFVNAGVMSIKLLSTSKRDREIYKITPCNLKIFDNAFYQLYLNNKYDDLKSKVHNTIKDLPFDACFYDELITGYSKSVFEAYDSVEFEKLSTEDKVCYLFNSDALDRFKIRPKSKATKSTTKKYINGITDLQQKNMYQLYMDIFNGNHQKMLSLDKSVNTLKEQYNNSNYSFVGCSSLQEFYKIQHIAIEQYMFYFCNNIFFKDFSDLKKILNTYIEAIMCTNGQFVEETSDLFGGTHTKERYAINVIDLDILTKFISIKDIYSLIKEYKVDKFNINDQLIDYLVESFDNIGKSIIKLELFNRFIYAPSILVNCALILTHVSLSEENKERVSNIIINLFSDKDFVEFFFSINFPDFRESLKVFFELSSKANVTVNFDYIKNIINSVNFNDYYVNSDEFLLEKFFINLLNKDEIGTNQSEICNYILSYEGKKSVMLIRLFKSIVSDEENKKVLSSFISDKFDLLSDNDIFDFTLSDWIILSDKNIDKLLDDVKYLYNRQKRGIIAYPNTFEGKLDFLIILYLTNKISNLDRLSEYAQENIVLQFLINPETFDYSNVDFSNYMWENVMRHDEYMNLLVNHKSQLIPKIQHKIDMGVASEFERKILYGKLLDEEELFIN